MTIEKRLPDVYGQHSAIDEACESFGDIPGRLVVSESGESPDWTFRLFRVDRIPVQAVLLAASQNCSRKDLVAGIRATIDRIISTLEQSAIGSYPS
jgi:hypothetical protein